MLLELTRNVERKKFLSAAKSLKIRQKDVHAHNSVTHKLKGVALLLFYPIYLSFHLHSTKKTHFAVELAGDGNENKTNSRQLYVAHYFVNDNINKVAYISGSTVYHKKISPEKLGRALTIWLLFVKAAIVTLFDKRRRNDNGNLRLLNLIVTAILCDKTDAFYFFRYYMESSYFGSFYLSHILSNRTYAIVGATFMFGKRYSYCPECTLCLCSSYQIEESKFYIDYGWMVFKDVLMTGPEEYYLYRNIVPHEPKYDVGIYSSGWWAREKGKYQTTDIEGIRNYKYTNNKYYNDFLSILDELAKINNTKSLTVIVYPHPYERRLKNDYQIECPYLDKLKSYGFEFCNDNQMNSLMNIYDCRIGIAIGSTILADRWNLGLEAISLVNDQFGNSINIDYLGSYRRFFFDNAKEMVDYISQNN